MSRCCASGWPSPTISPRDKADGELYDDAVDGGGAALPGPPRPRRDRQRRRADACGAQRAGRQAHAPACGLARPAGGAGLHLRPALRRREHSGGGGRSGRRRQGAAALRGGGRQGRPAVADADHADHRGQLQSDLDGAAVDHEEGHHHADAPRSGLRQPHAHARPRRQRRARSIRGRWTGSPTARRISPSGRIPAPGNALGAVRIDMPNPHAVYMHDTNHKEHFSADYRFHSSGCARVAEVRDLAAWLLEDNRRLGPQARSTPRSPRANAHRHRLAHKVPVAWVYFTGWVTRDGVDPLPQRHLRHATSRRPARSSRARRGRRCRPPPVPLVSYSQPGVRQAGGRAGRRILMIKPASGMRAPYAKISSAPPASAADRSRRGTGACPPRSAGTPPARRRGRRVTAWSSASTTCSLVPTTGSPPQP